MRASCGCGRAEHCAGWLPMANCADCLECSTVHNFALLDASSPVCLGKRSAMERTSQPRRRLSSGHDSLTHCQPTTRSSGQQVQREGASAQTTRASTAPQRNGGSPRTASILPSRYTRTHKVNAKAFLPDLASTFSGSTLLANHCLK